MNTAHVRLWSGGLVLVVAGSFVWLGERWLALREAEHALARLADERRVLTRAAANMNDAVLAGLEAECADADADLRARRAALGAAWDDSEGRCDDPGAPRSADAFFELAEFVAAQRAQARASGVMISDNESFGFDAYAHAGPRPAAIAAVMRQRRIVERILAQLFAAAPRQLLSLERSLTPEEIAAGTDAGASFSAGPGHGHSSDGESALASTDAACLRVAFAGRTQTLRSFLNALACWELPLFVRAVEVRPDEPGDRGGPQSASGGSGDLTSRLSRFAVTIACANALAAVGTNDTSAADPDEARSVAPSVAIARGAVWAELPGSSVWGGGRGEFFSPPDLRYDALHGCYRFPPEFAATAPAPADAETGDPVELELLAVEPVPFRLQLLGIVGDGSTCRAIVENQATGEVLLASAGTRIESLELTVCDVTRRREPVTLSDETTVLLPAAVATVRDERTGTSVTLTDRRRVLTTELAAVFASESIDQAPATVRVGEIVAAGTGAFRVDKIHLAPPAVSVTKLGAGQLASGTCTQLVPARALSEPAPGNLSIQ